MINNDINNNKKMKIFRKENYSILLKKWEKNMKQTNCEINIYVLFSIAKKDGCCCCYK